LGLIPTVENWKSSPLNRIGARRRICAWQVMQTTDIKKHISLFLKVRLMKIPYLEI